ncbi:hypothetical protein JCM6882_009141 [Rhodosporidiobolus microsporus]
MLLSLPIELIEHIVRLAAPPDHSSATYLERHDTLRELCLVCRGLRNVVQPVLGEVRRLRVLALESVDFALNLVGEECTKLEDVRLFCCYAVDLMTLERSPALRNLVLNECELLDTPIGLPALIPLTWSDSHSSDVDPIGFLRPTSVPSLRRINHFVEGQEAGIDDEPNLALPPALLAQLSPLVATYPPAGVPVAGSLPLVLLEAPLTNLSSSNFQSHLSRNAHHVRIFVTIYAINAPCALLLLTAALSPANTPSTSLRLLYLPTAYSPPSCIDDNIATKVSKLIAVCTARGIAVDCEDTDEGPGVSLPSPKFAEYARRRRE